MHEYIIHLNGSRLPPAVGNKASRLHFLARHGYRVPATHVCNWNAYLHYLQDDHALIAALSHELQRKIDLASAYAIRSSANIEDGLAYSFAGQFKSVLDVHGLENMLQALWSIWATTRTPSVEAYLIKHGVDPQQLRMAALIQEMVTPVVSGVAFSKNPLTSLNEVIVEAVRGSGELLVRDPLWPGGSAGVCVGLCRAGHPRDHSFHLRGSIFDANGFLVGRGQTMALDYLIDLQRDAPPTIGNKAKNICLLIEKKFSAPRTWVCTWEAFERYRANDVQIVESLKAELATKLDPGRAYAVRSSANIEDDFQHSFAGQFKSVLNVQGVDAVLQAMWSIWAMVDAANVQAYMKQLGRDPHELKMAVIVQEMVPPLISGVAFSKNPMTGLDEIVVEAVSGRGDQLVQGGMTPARWVHKWGKWITQPANTEVPLDVIAQVVSGVKQIARAYGSPIDLEWVYDGQRVQWVQLREITTLKNLHIYSNRISREVMPGLIKPLIWSVNVPLVNGAWLRLFTELIGQNDLDPLSFSKSFYYRSYFNMSVIGDILETLGMPRETLELLTGVQSSGPEKPRFKPTARTYRHLPRMARAAIDKWRIGGKFEKFVPAMWMQIRTFCFTETTTLSEAQLLAEIDRLYPLVQETAYYNIVVPLLMQFYNRLLSSRLQKQGVDFASFDLMRGLDELQNYDPNYHLAQLRQRYYYQPVDAAERQAAITAFLDRFGHLSDSGNDFSVTPWREQPEIVWKMIESQRVSDGPTHKIGPDEVTLSGLTRVIYRRARQFRLYREMIGSLYTYGYGLFRPYFRELGRRLAERGVIDQTDDVFLLSFDEIRRAVTTDREVDDLRSKIAQRQQEIDRVRDAIPPSIIYGDRPAPIETQPGDKLIGTPTSRGYYQGAARVVRGLKDFEKVQAGDVLIVPFSDVGWTPLFSRAGAVIAESGGMLSHSSIVAREYDIPAVVSVSGACQIPDGTLVTVDAYRGVVIIHADKLSTL